MKDFRNKVVYVTGGSSGIGLSGARRLATSGANIILFARRRERLEQAVEEISLDRRSDEQRFSCMQLDVSKDREVKEVMSRAVKEFGVPDVLINCAGRAYPRNFEDIAYEQLDETMKINFYGIWNAVSALVPHMKEKGGAIVNVSSMAGFIGVFGYTDYAASKFAIIGFSEALRSELKRYNIQVSVLCPPDTETPGFEVENRTKPEETQAVSAAAKLMQPDEVARAMIRGMRRGQFMIHCNFEGKAIFMAKRMVPSLVEWIMDRDVKKVQAKKA